MSVSSRVAVTGPSGPPTRGLRLGRRFARVGPTTPDARSGQGDWIGPHAAAPRTAAEQRSPSARERRRPWPLPIPGQLARPAAGCPASFGECRVVATGRMCGRRDPASSPRRATASQAAIGPVGASWRRTQETAPRLRQIVSIQVVIAHGAGSDHRACGRSVTSRCDAAQRPRAVQAMDAPAVGLEGGVEPIRCVRHRPAPSDPESRGRNSPGASVIHPGNRPIAVVIEPATPTEVGEPAPRRRARWSICHSLRDWGSHPI
jgi:hypothetical protein